MKLGHTCNNFFFDSKSPKEPIECDTLGVYYNSHNFTRLEDNYKLFSLGKVISFDYTSLEKNQFTFNLYPRNLENTSWLNHTIFNNKFDKQMSLFHLNTLPYYGLRVIKFECFSRLVDLFVNTTYEEIIRVGYSSKDAKVLGTIVVE